MAEVSNKVVGNEEEFVVTSDMIANDTLLLNTAGYGFSDMKVLEGGSAVRTKASTRGRIYVSNGGYAESSTVDGELASLTASSGAVISNTTVKNGELFVSAGASCFDVNITDTGIFYIDINGKDSGKVEL